MVVRQGYLVAEKWIQFRYSTIKILIVESFGFFSEEIARGDSIGGFQTNIFPALVDQVHVDICIDIPSYSRV